MYHIYCGQCESELDPLTLTQGVCPVCHEEKIIFQYKKNWDPDSQERSIWKYRSLLPIQDANHIVTLGEGMTPLLKSNISWAPHLYIKDESRNPTGSMKDRAMSVAYSKAKEMNIKQSILVSAGGAGIAASAYASKAGITNYILVPPGVSQERIMAMQIYGSELIEVQGNFEECQDVVRELVNEHGWFETTTCKRANPYTSEGPKTIAYELFEQCDQPPEYLFIPVGGGGTLGGIWRGFLELKERQLLDKVPRLVAVQNEKFNGLEIALMRGYGSDLQLRQIEIDSSAPTVTGGLRHSYVPDGVEALAAIRDTQGTVITVSDEEAMQGQRMIALSDGLFVEPSSATALVAYKKMLQRGEISAESSAVLLLTGSGYRQIADTIQHHGRKQLKMSSQECYQFLSKRGERNE